jgi:hypothetical protein
MIYRLAETPAGSATVSWRPQVLGFAPARTQVCTSPDSASPLTVMIPQSWVPGWQAWLDGQPIDLHSAADGGSMALQIDSPGCHTLELAYRPLPDLVGLGISGVTCIGILAGWLISRRRTSHV